MLEAETTIFDTKMKPLTSKQMKRMEKKKKKLATFLEIAKLNDKDRKDKIAKYEGKEEECSNNRIDRATVSPEEPRRKRHKKGIEVSENLNSIKSCEYTSNRLCHQDHVMCSTNNDLPDSSEESAVKRSEEKDITELKRELRERKNWSRVGPKFRLKELGEYAALTVKDDERVPLFLSNIRDLMLYCMLGQCSSYRADGWCHLEKYNRISHTVAFLVEGISLYDFLSHETSFKSLRKNFSNSVEVLNPATYSASLVEELALVPLTLTQKDRLKENYGDLETAVKNRDDLFKVLYGVFPIIESSESPYQQGTSKDKFSRKQLLLSASQLVEENYPLPLKGLLKSRYEGFIFTKDLYQDVTSYSPMFAVDCEMCLTTAGEGELTRISIVNEKLEVVYESFVKPNNKIVNYLTRYSGITEKSLANVEVRLEDVQRDIRMLLPPDAILIGHSLNCDLKALKLMHPYIIDTSVIYNLSGFRNRKAKLATLSQHFLGEKIQNGSSGHCSVEDSIACMKLTQLKLANFIEFGDAEIAIRKKLLIKYIEDQQMDGKCENVAPSVIKSATKLNKSVAIVGSEKIVNEYSAYISKSCVGGVENNNKSVKCLACPDEDVVLQTCNIALEHSLTLAHVCLNRPEGDIEPSMIEEVSNWCKAIWESMAFNGLCLILFSGHSRANGVCFIDVKKLSVPCRI